MVISRHFKCMCVRVAPLNRSHTAYIGHMVQSSIPANLYSILLECFETFYLVMHLTHKHTYLHTCTFTHLHTPLTCTRTATVRMAGAMEKSTDVMKAMQSLMKVGEVRESMMALSKEMNKVRQEWSMLFQLFVASFAIRTCVVPMLLNASTYVCVGGRGGRG